MKKNVDKIIGEKATERWENEGGEILVIILFNIRKKEVEKRQRRHGKTWFKRRALRNIVG